MEKPDAKDPDPQSIGSWIRIRIPNADSDPECDSIEMKHKIYLPMQKIW
jgi:hypothetical protein